MKKHLLLVILALVSLSAFSQTEVKTYMNVSGVWNALTEEYEYKNKEYSRITFTMYPNVIIAKDNANSVYRIVSDTFSDENSRWKSASWECRDEQNRQCVFLLMYHKNSNLITISVNYKSISYLYYVDTE